MGTLTKPILIIDAGHGGIDSGGGSSEKWLEKELTLKISLYQYSRLKALGVDCVLTRNKDMHLNATDRTNIIKNSGAKYCISNHINSGGGEGAETIYSIYNDGKLAKMILDEIKNAGQVKRRAFSKTLSNNAYADYYYIHRLTGAVGATIVNYGFADNENDVNRLLNNWKVYAEAVVKAFCHYADVRYSKSTHWAEGVYGKLNEAGIKIHERRFDDKVTRGEVMALLYELYKTLKEDMAKQK